MPTRLSDMDYDEISLVDVGACNDADVVLYKRAAPNSVIEIGGVSKVAPQVDRGPAPKASGSGNRKKIGNKQVTSDSMRGDHWNESRHPRVPSGNGRSSGEFAATSAASKEKYGKGGTAKDNLPANYKPKNDSSGLAHGITPEQQKLLDSASGGGGGSKKRKNKGVKGKSGSATKGPTEKQKQQEAAVQVAEINGLNKTQRIKLRQQGTAAPYGYVWSGDRLISARQEKLIAQVAGKPRNRVKKSVAVGPDGRISFSPDNAVEKWLFATEGGNLA